VTSARVGAGDATRPWFPKKNPSVGPHVFVCTNVATFVCFVSLGTWLLQCTLYAPRTRDFLAFRRSWLVAHRGEPTPVHHFQQPRRLLLMIPYENQTHLLAFCTLFICCCLLVTGSFDVPLFDRMEPTHLLSGSSIASGLWPWHATSRQGSNKDTRHSCRGGTCLHTYRDFMQLNRENLGEELHYVLLLHGILYPQTLGCYEVSTLTPHNILS
jgi:hypothetical protein